LNFFSLGVTAEALRAIIGSKSAISLQRGPVDPEFQVEGVPHQPFFFSVNWTDLSSVLSVHACDKQTDGRTDRQTDGPTDRILIAILRLHYIQRGKNFILF